MWSRIRNAVGFSAGTLALVGLFGLLLVSGSGSLGPRGRRKLTARYR